MISKEDASNILREVTDAVSTWKSLAHRLGIANREIDLFAPVFQREIF